MQFHPDLTAEWPHDENDVQKRRLVHKRQLPYLLREQLEYDANVRAYANGSKAPVERHEDYRSDRGLLVVQGITSYPIVCAEDNYTDMRSRVAQDILLFDSMDELAELALYHQLD